MGRDRRRLHNPLNLACAALCVALCGAVHGRAAAQSTGTNNTSRPARIWAAGGLVLAGSSNVEGGVGVLARLSYQRSVHQVSLRALGFTDVSGFPDSGGGDNILAGDVLYGRTHLMTHGHVALSTGLSAVQFDGCPKAATFGESCTTIGLPIVGEASLHSQLVGIGLQAFANINTKASFGGVALIFQLGWMPE